MSNNRNYTRATTSYAQKALRDCPKVILRSINKDRIAQGLSPVSGGLDYSECSKSQQLHLRQLRAKREHELLVAHPDWTVSRIEALVKAEFGS